MKYRTLGKTGLKVSEIGFGAWAIGGPAMAGDIPIGWGDVKEEESIRAIAKARELGINFFDTADFYGLGHSEELLGKVLKPFWNEIILATKVGHELLSDGTIKLNYSKNYIIEACERSLKRLQKDVIDVYQLHSARMIHLEQGECIEAMEKLQQDGKIRYWGISLNTFEPDAEAEFLMKHKIGDTFQVVFNIINQIAYKNVIKKAAENNYGIIARMPLQFGLLTGKFSKKTKFDKNDHRKFRLPPEVLDLAIEKLDLVWKIAEKYNVSKTNFALSFILNHSEVSTVIPGIKTVKQAEENSQDIVKLSEDDLKLLHEYFYSDLIKLVEEFRSAG